MSARRRRSSTWASRRWRCSSCCLALGSLAALIADVWSDGASRLSWEFPDRLPVAPGRGRRHLARAGRQRLRHPGHRRAGRADRRRRGDLSRGVRPRAASWRGSSRSTSPTSPRCRRSSTACSGSACSSARWAWDAACWRAPRRWRCSCCRSSSSPRAKRCGPCPRPFAKGRTRWAPRSGRPIWYQVLPVALPGILTGMILALSRAIGETAPLISIGALTFVAFAPDGIWSPFTVLPIQIFNWVSRPQVEFQANAAAGILVLLVAAPDDERRRHLAARPLPEEAVMSTTRRPLPVAGRRGRARQDQQPAGDRPVKIEARAAELLLRRDAGARGHLDRDPARTSSRRSSARRAAARARSCARSTA